MSRDASSDSYFHEKRKPVAPQTIAPKKGEKVKAKPSWDWEAPQYDQRSSCYISAGTDYGVGYKVPVGHSDGAKKDVPCLPRTPHMQEAT